jgi:hypothetical protein
LMPENGQTPWHIKGEEVGSCSCDWACPCQFEGDPTHGYCQVLVGLEIGEGNFGETDLSGVRFAEIVSFPGPLYEGNGTSQLILDEASTPEQRDAILALASGEQGGAYFEIFASIIPNNHDPVVAPIEIEVDREARVASIRVGDLGESEIKPIVSPATGEEHRVRIDLPNGFEYKQAEIGNTISARASGDDPLSFRLENSYAQMNQFDWSNV